MKELDKVIHDQKRNNYKDTSLSLYDRFWAQEKESEAWLNAVIMAKKESDKTVRNSKLSALCDNGKSSLDLNRQSIDNLIDHFTKSAYSDTQIDDMIELCNKANIFQNGRRDERDALIFDFEGKKIVVRTLSKTNPVLLEYFPELETNDRNCKCHEGSINMARALTLDNIRVSTGSYYMLSPKSMVLHSVAEANIDGEPYVIDYESNTLWEQDDFYKFYHFEPFESIPWTTMSKDIGDILYLSNIDRDYTKLYLTSRTEALTKSAELQNENKQ